LFPKMFNVFHPCSGGCQNYYIRAQIPGRSTSSCVALPLLEYPVPPHARRFREAYLSTSLVYNMLSSIARNARVLARPAFNVPARSLATYFAESHEFVKVYDCRDQVLNVNLRATNTAFTERVVKYLRPLVTCRLKEAWALWALQPTLLTP